MLWSTSDVTYWETFVATDVHKKLDMLLGKLFFSADTVLKQAIIT